MWVSQCLKWHFSELNNLRTIIGLFMKFGNLGVLVGLIRHAKFQECRSNSFWVMGRSKVARNGSCKYIHTWPVRRPFFRTWPTHCHVSRFRVLSPSSGVNIENRIPTKLETCVQVKVYLGNEGVGEREAVLRIFIHRKLK